MCGKDVTMMLSGLPFAEMLFSFCLEFDSYTIWNPRGKPTVASPGGLRTDFYSGVALCGFLREKLSAYHQHYLIML